MSTFLCPYLDTWTCHYIFSAPYSWGGGIIKHLWWAPGVQLGSTHHSPLLPQLHFTQLLLFRHFSTKRDLSSSLQSWWSCTGNFYMSWGQNGFTDVKHYFLKAYRNSRLSSSIINSVLVLPGSWEPRQIKNPQSGETQAKFIQSPCQLYSFRHSLKRVSLY